MQIPILTYHAANISGDSYETNDLIAFSKDLEIISELGYQIISLRQIASWLHDKMDLSEIGNKLIGLSFDDGLETELNDLPYFDHGVQKSVYHRAMDYLKNHPEQKHFSITSFVIASSKARKKIDSKSLKGQNLMGDHWWRQAQKTGILQIENHSWDHNHPDALFLSRKHSFLSVNSFRKCKKQVLKSQDYIESITGERPTLFAYPFGEHSDYLLNDFLPRHRQLHSLMAAFSCNPEMVTSQTNPWNIPRFVCGNHWKSSNQLKELLSFWV